uniref:DUF4283 domain-containing protein n=1 Tax=Setaria viridis TaxID=4556 RepID=A0A4U6WLX3_SETVI|nr:hypothetical protein SEVIR_1G179500v2 [Setaria viridis]
MAIGDPNTRPNEETIIVPNSFDLERDAREWEGTALVPWAIHMPRGAGARDIEDLLREQLRLQQGDIIVAVHQPEPFLIRFATTEQCATARTRGRFQGHGIDICLRSWRSLSHALGLRIFFHVRLYLDGIPIHACTPDIVERIIGTHCALQYINTNLVQQTDTRHVDLWAWTANPSAIPKRVWLLFTHRPADKSSTVTITTSLPDRWQQGVRYEVFLHLGVLEDYTAAARDLDGAINNPSAFTPTRRGYAWRYGLPDGAPSDARSKFPAKLPRPPRDTEQRVEEDRGHSRGTWDHGRDEQDKNNGRNDVSRRNRDSRRGGSGSCRNSFHWPRRPDDDDNDDGYDHPGRGRDRSSKLHDSRRRDVVRRDRTSFAAFAPALPRFNDLKAMVSAQVKALFNAQAMAIQHTFQAMANSQPEPWSTRVDEFFSRSCSLMDGIGLDTPPRLAGNQAWSDPALHLVPLQRVFDRLGAALHGPPSRREMQLGGDTPAVATEGLTTVVAASSATAAASAPSGSMAMVPAGTPRRPLASAHPGLLAVAPVGPLRGPAAATVWGAPRAELLGPVSGSGARALAPAGLLPSGAQDGPTLFPGPVAAAVGSARANLPDAAVLLPGPDDVELGQDTASPEDGRDTAATTLHDMQVPTSGAMSAHAAAHAVVDVIHDTGVASAAEGGSVDDLFAAPAPPILQQLPIRRQRTRRSFDMSSVHRSAKLSMKPSVPAMERAQRNLWRKLGVSDDELRPLEDILQEYINSHQWPLPDHIIAAMTALFDLDDEGQVNEALIQHAGQTVHDIQNELALCQE